MVGTPCPKCGSDLLTQSDYDFYESVIAPALDLIEYINGIVDPTGEKPRKMVSVHGHNGKVTVQ